MSCGFYISPFLEDFSWRVEEKCRTDNSDIYFSIVLFLTNDSELLMKFSWCIRDELDAEIILVAKFLMRILAIFGYSDDLDPEFSKLWSESREVLCFECAARSIIFRVEVEEYTRRCEERREIHKLFLGKDASLNIEFYTLVHKTVTYFDSIPPWKKSF